MTMITDPTFDPILDQEIYKFVTAILEAGGKSIDVIITDRRMEVNKRDTCIMTDYDTTIRVLRNLAAMGNTVAATYLHVLMNCPAENRAEVIGQITAFINGFNHQIAQVGPTEFKTIPVEYVDHHPV